MSTNVLKLTVAHLEDQEKWAEEFQREAEGPLCRGIEALLREIFSSPAHQPVFAPDVSVDLKLFRSLAELTDGLIEAQDGGFSPTTAGAHVGCFLLDYYMPPQGESKNERDFPVFTLPVPGVCDVTFGEWLGVFYPHVPVILLTKETEAGVAGYPDHWLYETKHSIENPYTFVRRILQFLRDQWTPRFAAQLLEYAVSTGMDSWHTPGHNAGNAFRRSPVQRAFFDHYGPQTFATDLSVSVDELGDLSERALGDLDRPLEREKHPDPLRQAQELSAEIFGAGDTFFVTNGTSTSNKAMLTALLRPGDVVLVDRNCHKSVHHAVVMAGALPVYLPPRYNEALQIWAPLSLDEIEGLIESEVVASLKPKLLVMTTCTYEGILYPVDHIARLCEQHQILLYADEAWAPYLRFHPRYSWCSRSGGPIRQHAALDAGAHFVVHSTHKALAAFSQASMIHVSHRFASLLHDHVDRGRRVSGEVDDDGSPWGWLRDRFGGKGLSSYTRFQHELMETLRYWHSTSPHYPMLASLDRAGVQMRLEGMQRLDQCLTLAQRLREFFRELNCAVELSDIVGSGGDRAYRGYHQDPLKVLAGFKTPESGQAFQAALRSQAHVRWEKATDGCIQFLVTIGTYPDAVEHLLAAARANREHLGVPRSPGGGRNRLRRAVAEQVSASPREAFSCLGELVPLAEAADGIGRVAAQMIVPYPPGIPVVLPGLRVTSEIAGLVMDAIEKQGAEHVHGVLHIQGVPMVRVMKPEEENAAARHQKAFLEKVSALTPAS